MKSEKLKEWLNAVELLATSEEGWYIENDFDDFVRIGNMSAGRYEKYARGDSFYEFCGVTDSAAEAVLWLYENNKPDEEF
jgi:hypothetical protein